MQLGKTWRYLMAMALMGAGSLAYPAGVCDRNPSVQEGILRAVHPELGYSAPAPLSECNTVTAGELEQITNLYVFFDPDRSHTIRRADFDGLTALKKLTMDNAQNTDLAFTLAEEDTFAPLKSLETLVLINVKRLTAANLRPLGSLTALRLQSLEPLSADLLVGSKLTSLKLTPGGDRPVDHPFFADHFFDGVAGTLEELVITDVGYPFLAPENFDSLTRLNVFESGSSGQGLIVQDLSKSDERLTNHEWKEVHQHGSGSSCQEAKESARRDLDTSLSRHRRACSLVRGAMTSGSVGFSECSVHYSPGNPDLGEPDTQYFVTDATIALRCDFRSE